MLLGRSLGVHGGAGRLLGMHLGSPGGGALVIPGGPWGSLGAPGKPLRGPGVGPGVKSDVLFMLFMNV